MNDRRKTERRKTNRRMATRIGKIYRVGSPPSEAVIKLIGMEEDHIIIDTLAESRTDIDLQRELDLGYKIHVNRSIIREAHEVLPKELPLYLTWPYKSEHYYKELKGGP